MIEFNKLTNGFITFMQSNNYMTAILIIMIIYICYIFYYFLGIDPNNTQNFNLMMPINDMLSLLTNTLLMTIVIGVIVLNIAYYFFNINIPQMIYNYYYGATNKTVSLENPTGTKKCLPSDKLDSVYGKKDIKEEVYHISNNDFTYAEATKICAAYGARLATYEEVEESYENGAEWCNYGWSDDQMILFPTQKATYDFLKEHNPNKKTCGRPGINGGWIQWPNLKFGVNCYGIKPTLTEKDEEFMKTNKIDIFNDLVDENGVPLTSSQIVEKEQELQKQKENVQISPFNFNFWNNK